jgi:hypothetical protein
MDGRSGALLLNFTAAGFLIALGGSHPQSVIGSRENQPIRCSAAQRRSGDESELGHDVFQARSVGGAIRGFRREDFGWRSTVAGCCVEAGGTNFPRGVFLTQVIGGQRDLAQIGEASMIDIVRRYSTVHLEAGTGQ